MTPSRPIPFGPDHKDGAWRWGAFFVGAAAIAVLVWIWTLGGINLFGRWWLMSLLFGGVLSIRAGRAWSKGLYEDVQARRETEPTVDVRGQAGSTYVLLEPRRGPGGARRPRPREFGPFWWALYTVVVRAPVALGDFVLTAVWRLLDGFWSTSTSSLARQLQMDQIDHPQEMRDPDRDRF